jgi:hypothetical protein
MNDDEYSFYAFPDVIDGFKERIIALKVGDVKWPNFDSQTKEALIAEIESEIQGFINFLLNYKIPDHVYDERFGCGLYMHPDIEKASFDKTPEAALLHAIQDLIRGPRMYRERAIE